MLPRVNRLSKNNDIRAVLKNGRRIGTPYLEIYYQKRISRQPSRLAIIVGKKVSPQAVTRHSYQRRLRHIARSVFPLLNSSFDMVWVAKPAITKITKSQLIQNSLVKPLAKLYS